MLMFSDIYFFRNIYRHLGLKLAFSTLQETLRGLLNFFLAWILWLTIYIVMRKTLSRSKKFNQAAQR